MTPYLSVPGETFSVTLEGLTAFTAHFFAVVPVDALDGFDANINYTGAYVLSPEVISREVSLFVGEESEPPYAQAISHELMLW